jgi:hypothetical protein
MGKDQFDKGGIKPDRLKGLKLMGIAAQCQAWPDKIDSAASH